MANLKWNLNPSRGSIDFGRLVPLAGSTYGIDLTGGEQGKTYSFYVMDEEAKVCLANSTYSSGAYSIAFNTAELRSEFERKWHEIRQFHTLVSDGTNTIAEGDLSITWNPGWTDAATGSVYSFKGPKGDTGPGISSIAFTRYDAYGNCVYTFTLSDGNSFEVVFRRGDSGTGIVSINANGYDASGNAKYTIVLSNGSTYPIVCPKGPVGDTGNGIASVAITAQDLLKITYTNGTEWTSETSIRGPQGSQGNQGVGILRVDDAGLDADGNHKYTIVLSNNSTYQIVCPKGPLGNTGNGIASMSLTEDYKIRVTYTSGSTWTSDVIRGPAGERGPMGDGSYIFDSADNKWHNVTVYTNEYGEKTVQVAPVGTDTRPGMQSAHAATHRTGGSDALTPADIGAQSVLTFDSTPTSGSTNPATSGGIHDFVNSSISTNTANYISNNGQPFTSVAALEEYAGVKTNNDYAFVVGTDAAGNTTYTRYKYSTAVTPAAWAAEYVLNNSSFTAAQWAAISSGLSASDKTTVDNATAHMATANIHVPIVVTNTEPTDPTPGTIYFITGS